MVSKYNKLYWCDDGVGYRSQCIIALSMREAKKHFSKLTGGYIVDISALKLMRLPKEYQRKTLDWQPTEKILEDCQIVILSDPNLQSSDPMIQKLVLMSKRHYKFNRGRVFWFRNLKSRYVLQEKVLKYDK